jgi:hypothetical protein
VNVTGDNLSLGSADQPREIPMTAFIRHADSVAHRAALLVVVLYAMAFVAQNAAHIASLV